MTFIETGKKEEIQICLGLGMRGNKGFTYKHIDFQVLALNPREIVYQGIGTIGHNSRDRSWKHSHMEKIKAIGLDDYQGVSHGHLLFVCQQISLGFECFLLPHQQCV